MGKEARSSDWFNMRDTESEQPDCYSNDWAGLNWSHWIPLGYDRDIPKDPGIYRIRHTSDERPWLERIGITNQEDGLRGRILYQLSSEVYEDKTAQTPFPERPGTEPHKAAPCINAISKEYSDDGRLEFSHASPDRITSEWWREGLEDALVALHRKEIGHSPTCFQGRMISGYEDWDLRYKKDGVTADATKGPGPLDWKKNHSPTSDGWMGLEWTKPRPISEIDHIDLPRDVGVYRTWYRNYPLDSEANPLVYVGEGKLRDRLVEADDSRLVENGPHAMFSVAECPPDVDSTRQRKEIETELIGAHHYLLGHPPLGQYCSSFYAPPDF